MKQLKQHFAGSETNTFFGRVVNRFDDNNRGRVRIRIFAVHPEDTTLVPDEDLPWAWPIQSLMSAALDGVGMTPHGLLDGSIVWGIFQDGADAQMPVILGCLQKGELPPLAIGTQSLPKGETVGIEPGTPYGAEYPFNKVFMTESGHAIEIDDTPGAERIHVWHRMGSYSEFRPDGSVVHKIIGSGFQVFVEDNNIYTQGETNIYSKGNLNVEAYNDANINVSGDANISVAEDFRVKAANAYIEAAEINLKGAVKATSVDTPAITADSASLGSVQASSIQAGSVQSTFSPGGGSGGGADTPGPSGLNTPQERDVEIFVPTVEDYHAFVNDDTDTPEVLLETGTVTEEELTTGEVGEPVAAANTVPATSTLCGITLTPGQSLDPIRLTPNFTVGKLSSYAVVTKNRVVAQGGLTENEIVCNLKLLAENCLEKILAQYPDMIVTSGFRSPAARSQHTKGMAADIQFTGLNSQGSSLAVRQAYLDRAQWVVNNVAFDDFILEYKSFGTRLPWLHISFNKDNLRRQIRTFNNNASVGSGLRLVSP